MNASGKIVPSAALITGAAARIGRVIALDLAAAGWAVGIHYNISAEAAHETVAEIEKSGGRAIALQGDLTDENRVRDLVAETSAALGPVSCLINNASVFEGDTIKTVNRDSWLTHMDTNLYAPVILSQAFANDLPTDKNGCIVNIIDQRVWALTPKFLSYTMSKTALWTLTQTLAQALSPRIRVMGIGPGPTLQNTRQSDADFANQVDHLLLKRAIDPLEIASTVRFILDTPSLTGQMLALDGGQHLAWETPDVAGVRE